MQHENPSRNESSRRNHNSRACTLPGELLAPCDGYGCFHSLRLHTSWCLAVPMDWKTSSARQAMDARCWLLCIVPFIWSLPTALMVGELASALPEDGGFYIWVSRALGRFWGFQEAWLSLSASVFDMAIYPALAVAYLGQLNPASDSWPSRPGVVAGRGGDLRCVEFARRIFRWPRFFVDAGTAAYTLSSASSA